MSKYSMAIGSSLFVVLVCAMNVAAAPRHADTVTVSHTIPMPFSVVRGNFAEWTGGNLVVVEDRWSASPTFITFDRDGNRLSSFSFTMPGVDRINLYDNSVAVGKDGSLAIVGTLWDGSGGGTFVAWVSADRRHQTVIRPANFFPESVTMPTDDTIWVSGYKRATYPGEKPGNDHQLILRYDRSGKLLGSIAPLLNIPDSTAIGRPPSILVSWGDGVGWYYAKEQAYVEFSLDGSVAHRLKGPQNPRGVFTLAACPNGNVFAASKKGTEWGIFSLNREQSDWTFSPRQEKWGVLLGCDDTSLVSITDFSKISWLETAAH